MFAISDVAAVVIAALVIVAVVLVALVALGRRGRRIHIAVDVGDPDDDETSKGET